STLLCWSVAEALMSRASSCHRPDASALPDRLTPSGPGNISGNSVRMVARQVIETWSCESRRFVALDFRGQFDHHAAASDVDGRHNSVGERQQHGGAGRRHDLDDVAGAEIMDRDELAER